MSFNILLTATSVDNGIIYNWSFGQGFSSSIVVGGSLILTNSKGGTFVRYDLATQEILGANVTSGNRTQGGQFTCNNLDPTATYYAQLAVTTVDNGLANTIYSNNVIETPGVVLNPVIISNVGVTDGSGGLITLLFTLDYKNNYIPPTSQQSLGTFQNISNTLITIFEIPDTDTDFQNDGIISTFTIANPITYFGLTGAAAGQQPNTVVTYQITGITSALYYASSFNNYIATDIFNEGPLSNVCNINASINPQPTYITACNSANSNVIPLIGQVKQCDLANIDTITVQFLLYAPTSSADSPVKPTSWAGSNVQTFVISGIPALNNGQSFVINGATISNTNGTLTFNCIVPNAADQYVWYLQAFASNTHFGIVQTGLAGNYATASPFMLPVASNFNTDYANADSYAAGLPSVYTGAGYNPAAGYYNLSCSFDTVFGDEWASTQNNGVYTFDPNAGYFIVTIATGTVINATLNVYLAGSSYIDTTRATGATYAPYAGSGPTATYSIHCGIYCPGVVGGTISKITIQPVVLAKYPLFISSPAVISGFVKGAVFDSSLNVIPWQKKPLPGSITSYNLDSLTQNGSSNIYGFTVSVPAASATWSKADRLAGCMFYDNYCTQPAGPWAYVAIDNTTSGSYSFNVAADGTYADASGNPIKYFIQFALLNEYGVGTPITPVTPVPNNEAYLSIPPTTPVPTNIMITYDTVSQSGYVPITASWDFDDTMLSPPYTVYGYAVTLYVIQLDANYNPTGGLLYKKGIRVTDKSVIFSDGVIGESYVVDVTPVFNLVEPNSAPVIQVYGDIQRIISPVKIAFAPMITDLSFVQITNPGVGYTNFDVTYVAYTIYTNGTNYGANLSNITIAIPTQDFTQNTVINPTQWNPFNVGTYNEYNSYSGGSQPLSNAYNAVLTPPTWQPASTPVISPNAVNFVANITVGFPFPITDSTTTPQVFVFDANGVGFSLEVLK